MKKILLVFFMTVSAVVLLASTSFAAATGNLVIHFQKWDADYSNVGLNSWGDDAVPGLVDPDTVGWTEDEFGVMLAINGLAAYEEGVTEGTIGIQAVGFDGSEGSWSANWGMKLANFEVPREKIVDGKTTHVYAFEGSVNRETDITEDLYADPIYADPDAQGVLIVYFDPSNAYEENLGVHSWGWADGSNAAEWNDPLKIFQKVGRTSDNTMVYAGILSYNDPETDSPGAIVYYGDGDDSKKTGNLEPRNSENEAYIETPKTAGELDVIYVLNKGGNYTANDNIWLNDAATFADVAFSFKLTAYDAEAKTGTYATDPNTIIVQLSSLLENPYVAATTEQEQDDAVALIESWFTVREVTGEDTFGSPLSIERVDFAKTNDTIDSFVVVLEDDGLDNTKSYQLDFDDLLEEGNHAANILLDLDTQAPELVFISPVGIIGQEAGNRVIEVEWGKAFDQNLFPGFRVTDDRDGDLTPFVYVPAGDNATLDTRTEGDYTIMLRVVDKWGNVTEETFIFRVVAE